MSAVTLQIAIMVAVLGSLVWLATRRSRARGAQRPPDGHSWSSDAVYNIGDAGQHHGGSGYDAGAGHSTGAGDSGGGSDGGGGGGSDSGGGGGSD